MRAVARLPTHLPSRIILVSRRGTMPRQLLLPLLLLAACTGSSFHPLPISDGGSDDAGVADLAVGGTCGDGKKNGAETDVDCGGGTCGPCAPGKTCFHGSDCTSGTCTNNACAAPSCNDRM